MCYYFKVKLDVSNLFLEDSEKVDRKYSEF
jgi:hypothetical protein